MGKWQLTMDPVQEWGEEVEDGVLYGITLRRESVPDAPSPVPEEAQPAQAFVQYRTSRVRRLKAATLSRLVTHLLDPAYQEPDFEHIFLSTYRAFTDTSTLIELLFQRDDMVSELDNSDSQKSTLLPLIRTWLDEFSEDFWEPPQHRPLRLLSAHLNHRPCFRRLAPRTDALLKKFQSEEHRPAGLISAVHKPAAAVLEEEEGTSEEGSAWENAEELGDFMHFPDRDIAEELTRLDAGLFVKVVPFQCLGCVWSQRDKKEGRNLAPTVRATVAQFNAVTNRVITSLLCPPAPASPDPRRQPPGPARRARIIEKWISVAQECRRLRNLSSLRAILSALQSNAVYRLKKTWAAVSRESAAVLDNLCETFPDENCVLTSREMLVEEGNLQTEDSTSSPRSPNLCTLPRHMNGAGGVVPYLGTYLTALMMLDTALPDTVGGGLINFEKRRREFEILLQIRQLKQACSQYSLPHHPNVAPWLQENRRLTDQESYDLSRELEPPVDPCPASVSIWNHLLISKKLTSLVTASEGSGRKMHADQISVSSSGSSGSEMEDVTTPQPSPRRFKLKSLSKSCQDVGEDFPTSSSSSSSASCSPSSSSCNSQPDLSSPPLSPLCPEPCPSMKHQRSMSLISLPVYNKQVDDSCIVRVSVESINTGNVYKSILLTNQDKTAQVIQRALLKHSLEEVCCQDFTLCQVLSQDKELRIPEKANVFYAMSTSANYDFVLRRKWRCHYRPRGRGGSSPSLGSLSEMCHTTSVLDDLLQQKRK
ncbi:ral guanine nucleotide dissociation stimulator-like 1 isoform X2 [Conger conger]|uniref:ral guanine nucleotide dissociation stimulator-like 1 isoform X2 n=1 Tax=Conger conger TaxID=82655 RepID=UPI002A5A2A8C|nr:ral guanine nucleotide dissociation stimulator-like 1 isoform X2 [Conger conger]